MAAQLIVTDVTFSYGPRVVLDGVTLTVSPRDRVGVVAPNGAGKSTLLALMAGRLVPDRGTVATVPADATVGLLTQRLDDRPGETIGEVLARRAGVDAVVAELSAATEALAAGEPGAADRYDRALGRYLGVEAATFEERSLTTLARVGLADADPARPASALSGGQRNRVNLAATLLATHDVVLLDEPTNDLDLDGLALLEEMVLGWDRGVVVVSHDRAFLERTVTSVVEIDDHDHQATRYEGGFAAWQQARATERRHAEEAFGQYVATRDALKAKAQQAREWSRHGQAKVRRSGENDKLIRAKNRQDSQNLGSKASRAERALERLDTVDKPFEGWELRLRFAAAERSGEEVASLHGAVVRRGAYTLGPVDVDLRAGDRVLVTGPNGGGKSTLIGALLGEIPLEAGTQHLGRSVQVGRLAQERRPFGDAPCLLDGFVTATGMTMSEARSQLAKLGLDGERVRRPAGELSPGEQTRAALAALAATGTNLLVLDEPTNHLDLPAIEQLEAALGLFSGTVVLVTHDRRLRDAFTATRWWRVEAGAVTEGSGDPAG